MLHPHFRDSLIWGWETLKKKRLGRQNFWENYGELLQVITTNSAEWEMLCSREKDWSGVTEALDLCTACTLGQKLFGSLSKFVTGARVARAVKQATDAWAAAKETVTSMAFRVKVQQVAEEALAPKHTNKFCCIYLLTYLFYIILS